MFAKLKSTYKIIIRQLTAFRIALSNVLKTFHIYPPP